MKQTNAKAKTTSIIFLDKSDGIISPAPENLKITSANINEIKNVVNNNSKILGNLIDNPPTSQTRFFKGEIKQFETATDFTVFANSISLKQNIDYIIFNDKFFLNNNPNSSGQYFSGGNSILTKNHLPYYNLDHNHSMPPISRVYNSRGGSGVGVLAESNLRPPAEGWYTNPSAISLTIGTTSPQTIYNLIYYKDVNTIKFLRNI